MSDILKTEAQLEAIYGRPAEAATVKEVNWITPHYRAYIEAAPYAALATSGPEGLDCSPRGDKPGFVRVHDEKTLMLPDRRGNNRIDSLANIVRDPRVALMFLIPGSSTSMRVNGRAVVRIDEAITQRFVMDGRHPRSVVVISIEAAYSQCARAVLRADLWNPEKFRDTACLPTVGQMLASAKKGFDGVAYDREWPGRAAKTMW